MSCESFQKYLICGDSLHSPLPFLSALCLKTGFKDNQAPLLAGFFLWSLGNGEWESTYQEIRGWRKKTGVFIFPAPSWNYQRFHSSSEGHSSCWAALFISTLGSGNSSLPLPLLLGLLTALFSDVRWLDSWKLPAASPEVLHRALLVFFGPFHTFIKSPFTNFIFVCYLLFTRTLISIIHKFIFPSIYKYEHIILLYILFCTLPFFHL